MKLYYFLMNLLFPPKCALCRCLLEKEETDLCGTCRMEAPWYPNRKRKLQFLDSFAAVWYYEGNVRKSLLRFKFQNGRALASPYGRILAMTIQKELPEGVDVLTWVPVSPLRKFTRGYDQVELIARAVGQELGVRPQPVLKKIRHNRPQSRIRGEAQRRGNVLGVYQILDPAAVADKRVLILDDILTTGATAGECARVLLTAGAKDVYCAAMAAARK